MSIKKVATLVVDAGSSGAQIADELMQSGRRVYLSGEPDARLLPADPGCITDPILAPDVSCN